MAATIVAFRNERAELRDTILAAVGAWTKHQREQAYTNGAAAEMLADAIIGAGYRKGTR